MVPNRASRAPIVVLALIGAYVVAAVLANARVTAVLFDDRKLEQGIIDLSWQIQLAWRAHHGEWVGRDFPYPLGPLSQLLLWLATGFGGLSAGRFVAGTSVVFPAVGIALAAWATVRALAEPWRRVLCLVALAVVALWSQLNAARIFIVPVALLVYAPLAAREDDRPELRSMVIASGLVALAGLLSYDRGLFGLVGVAAAASYEVVARRLERRLIRPAFVRAGLFLATFTGWQVLCTALARIAWGTSYIGYLAQQRALAGSYTLGLAEPISARAFEGMVGLLVGATALALIFVTRRGRDTVGGMCLVAMLPSLAIGLVRSDEGHVFQGIAPVGVVLLVVFLRQTEHRRWMAWLTGVLAALMWLGWLGAHPGPLLALQPKVFVNLVDAERGRVEPDRGYAGTLTQVRRFVREKKEREHIACVGLYQGGDVLHALEDIPGPTQVLMRWSPALREQLARRIEHDRCPYFVQELASFDETQWTAWNVGEDFVALARLYEPYRQLGPNMWALRLRDQPAPETATEVPAETLGTHQQVPLPGSLALDHLRPIDSTHLVRLEYTVELGAIRPYLGGVPPMTLEFLAGGVPLSKVRVWLPAINRRTTLLVPVSASDAEARWIAGQEPPGRRTVDGIRLGFERATRTTPAHVTVTIHSITELAPGAAPVPVGPCVLDRDLLADPLFRWASLLRPAPDVILTPALPEQAPAELFFPARPCPSTCLLGHLGLDPDIPAGGDGARVQIHVLTTAERPLLLDHRLQPGTEIGIELPLARWAGQAILVRLAVPPEANFTSDYDWVHVQELRLGACTTPRFSLGLASGSARPLDSHPNLEPPFGVFLHPNVPTDPPARVVMSVRPDPGSCLISTVRLKPAPGRSDGVSFFGELIVPEGTYPLFQTWVSVPDQPTEIRVPLATWANRDVQVTIGTRPGPTTNYDWAIFEDPRIAPCGP